MKIAAPYRNKGNDLVLSMVPKGSRRILDVGCGAGDNARRLKKSGKGVQVVGITHSEEEAALAAPYLSAVHVLDLEHDALVISDGLFDLLIFSHVLEHLHDPVTVMRRFLPLLKVDGHVLVAVPNTLEWRTRIAFLCGRFDYAEHGILDRTHLRFYTYRSASKELLDPISELRMVSHAGAGGAPLGPLRRFGLTNRLRTHIDSFIVRSMPNLFAREIVMLAQKEARAGIPKL